MTDRNMGIFELQDGFIRDEPDKVAEIFALMKFVPIRAYALFATQTVEYAGMSAIFPRIEAGCTIPKYCLRITESETGDIECVEI